LLVAPIGGVLVQTNVLRDLIMVIPATLLATIGLAAVLEWIVRAAQRIYPSSPSLPVRC
jgi:hypothetical protein